MNALPSDVQEFLHLAGPSCESAFASEMDKIAARLGSVTNAGRRALDATQVSFFPSIETVQAVGKYNPARDLTKTRVMRAKPKRPSALPKSPSLVTGRQAVNPTIVPDTAAGVATSASPKTTPRRTTSVDPELAGYDIPRLTMPSTVSDTAAAARTSDATQTAATEAVARRASGAAPSRVDMADTAAMTPADLRRAQSDARYRADTAAMTPADLRRAQSDARYRADTAAMTPTDLMRAQRDARYRAESAENAADLARRDAELAANQRRQVADLEEKVRQLDERGIQVDPKDRENIAAARRQLAARTQTSTGAREVIGGPPPKLPPAPQRAAVPAPPEVPPLPSRVGEGLQQLPPDAADQAALRFLAQTPGGGGRVIRPNKNPGIEQRNLVGDGRLVGDAGYARARSLRESGLSDVDSSVSVDAARQLAEAGPSATPAERLEAAIGAARAGTPENISGRSVGTAEASAAMRRRTQQLRGAASEGEAAANRSAGMRPAGTDWRSVGPKTRPQDVSDAQVKSFVDDLTDDVLKRRKITPETSQFLENNKDRVEAEFRKRTAAETAEAKRKVTKTPGAVSGSPMNLSEVRRASEGEVAGLIERIKGGSLEAKDRLLEMVESGSVSKGIFDQINKVTASAQKSTRSMNALMAGVSVPVFDAVDRSKNILGRISQLDNEIAEVAKRSEQAIPPGGRFGATDDFIERATKDKEQAAEQLKTLQKERNKAADELGNVVFKKDAAGNLFEGEFKTLQELTESVRNGREVTPDLLSRFSGDQIFQDLGAVRLTPDSRRMIATIFGDMFPPTGVSAQADEAAAGLAETLGKEIDPAYLAAAGAAGLGAGLLMGGE